MRRTPFFPCHQEEGREVVNTPLEILRVTPGLRHRLRIVSASSYICPMAVSIDNHRLTVVAVDGAEVVPRTVDVLEIISGEALARPSLSGQSLSGPSQVNQLPGCMKLSPNAIVVFLTQENLILSKSNTRTSFHSLSSSTANLPHNT